MALAAQSLPAGHSDSAGHRRAIRSERITVATVAAGAALAVLVGHDGVPGWQAARLATVALLTGAAVVAERRWAGRRRGWAVAGAGIVVLAASAGYLPFVAKDLGSLESVAGSVGMAAGLVLTVAGMAMGGDRDSVRLIVGGVLTVFVLLLVASVVGIAVAGTNVPRPAIGATPASRGFAYEEVTLATDDGVSLAGWYVASANRAAVVLLHGAGSTRSNVLGQAAVLAGHGFGVLMVDARGHGASGGRAMDFGWHGDADIAAAIRYLAARPDVDPERIGAVGLSMGGEEAIGATATNPLIRAVVAEGATGRTAEDAAWLSDEFGARGTLQEQIEWLQDRVTDVLTSASVPASLRAAAETSQARYLMITAGDVLDEGHAAAYVTAGAPGRAEIWTVPGAGHTDGLSTAPAEWEQRVVSFLNGALRPGLVK
jgi:dienelactone hydrolase